MTPALLLGLIATVGLVALLVGALRRKAKPSPASPTGMTIGPWINGETRSPGYPMHLPRSGEGWLVQLAPEKELSAVIDHDFRIPAGATKLVWHYRADIAEATPVEAPQSPALVSLMIQRRGDDWSGQGPMEFYRFFSPAFPLETGEHVREIPLQGWIGVFGRQGDMGPVLADLATVSVIFGHNAGRAHGVSGTGTFRQISLRSN